MNKFVSYTIGSILLILLGYASLVVTLHAVSSVILPSSDAPKDWKE